MHGIVYYFLTFFRTYRIDSTISRIVSETAVKVQHCTLQWNLCCHLAKYSRNTTHLLLQQYDFETQDLYPVIMSFEEVSMLWFAIFGHYFSHTYRIDSSRSRIVGETAVKVQHCTLQWNWCCHLAMYSRNTTHLLLHQYDFETLDLYPVIMSFEEVCYGLRFLDITFLILTESIHPEVE
jgi:hypothetical protein